MSFGLGYIADGFLRGQDRNRNWGLRQKQEERAQEAENRAKESHGINKRIGLVNADLAEERMTDDAKERRKREEKYQTDTMEVQLENQKLQKKANQQQNTLRAEGLTPESVDYRKKMQEQNLKSTKLSNQYQEHLNTKAGKEVSDEVRAWEKHIEKIVNQSDEANAQVELSQALDAKRFRMIQLVESGDGVGAAMFVNMSRANDKSDVAQMQKTEDGGLVGLDANGEIVINIAPEEVKGVISRIKSKQPTAKQPTVKTSKTYDDMGNVNGERPYIIKTDPRTGEQYIKYLEEKPPAPVSEEELSLADMMVQSGEMTPEQFKQLYGQSYSGAKPNAGQKSTQSQENYDVEVPYNF